MEESQNIHLNITSLFLIWCIAVCLVLCILIILFFIPFPPQIYSMTLRLSAFFEEQIRTIISEYKTAIKSSERLRRSQRFRKKMQDQPSTARSVCRQNIQFYRFRIVAHNLKPILFPLSAEMALSFLKSKEACSQNSGKSGDIVSDQIYLSQSVCSRKGQEESKQQLRAQLF